MFSRLDTKHLHHLFLHNTKTVLYSTCPSTEGMLLGIIDIINLLHKRRPFWSLILQSSPTTCLSTRNRTPRIRSRYTLGKTNPLSLQKQLFHRS